MTGYPEVPGLLWEAAPVINTVGIRDAGGNWYGGERGAAGGADAAVEDYRVLLYSNVFDKKDRPGGFCPDGGPPVSPAQTRNDAGRPVSLETGRPVE